MGRARHEKYIDYRTRKMNEIKQNNDSCILVTGLFFLAIGIIFTVIWYVGYYTPPVIS